MVPIDGTNLDLTHAQNILGKAPMDTSIFLSKRYRDDIDMNYIAKHNQRLVNEASIKLDFDALMVNDWNLYPEGFKPCFLDDASYVDHLGRIFKTKHDVKTTYWVDGKIKSSEDLENFESGRKHPYRHR